MKTELHTELPLDSSDDWRSYQKLVLAELERHNAWLASLDGKLDEVRIEIARLKVKSGLWGAAAGIIGAVVMGMK